LLIDGAKLPTREEVTEDLKELSECLAELRVTLDNFEEVFRAIVPICKECIRQGTSVIGRTRKILAAAIPGARISSPCWVMSVVGSSRNVSVHFHVIHRHSFSARKRVIVRWAQKSELSPVVILYIPRAPQSPEFGFLIVNDWLRRKPGLLLGESRRIKVGIPVQRISERALREFGAMLETEINTVARTPPTLWRPSRTPLAPFGPAELFTQLGRLHQFEPPAAVLAESQNVGRLMTPEDQYRFLRGLLTEAMRNGRLPSPNLLEDLPETTKWLLSSLSPPNAKGVQDEAKELRRFLRAAAVIKSEDLAPSLPGYRWQQISTWRVLVQLFPMAGLSILSRFCQTASDWKRLPEQTVASLLLTSTLATRDEPTSNAAHDLMRQAGRDLNVLNARNSTEYLVVANFHAAQAEAGGQIELERYRRFTEHRELEEQDLLLMRNYYGGNDEHSAKAVMRKLKFPSKRLLNTLPHEIWRAEVFRRRGIRIA
jgi:hypothetical protein